MAILKSEWLPHSEKQDLAAFSSKKYTMCLTGVQWGKSTVGAWRMKLSMATHTDPLDTFIIAAPTYKIMRQSTLPAFLTIMDGLGEYKGSEQLFKMYNGGTCYMRTATQPDSVVGITNCRHVWVDEGGKVSLYFWENLQARASFKEAPITVTSSPYTLNWVYKDFIRPMKKGLRDDTHLLQARSDENPYFPKKEFEARKLTMHPKRFNAIYGGEFEQMEGMVYDCFHEDENICDPFTFPHGTIYHAGVDFGFTHPAVILVIAKTPNGDHYLVSETYRTSMTVNDLIEVATMKKKLFGIKVFWCDPSQPAVIEEFNRRGLNAIGARNDVRVGIDRVYGLIKTRRFKIFKGVGKYLIDEFTNYHWQEHEEYAPNRDVKDRDPVKQNDDGCDALRYCIISTTHDTAYPIVGGGNEKKTYEQRMKDLVSNVEFDSHAEKWS